MALWTPEEINPLIWLDAEDDSTIGLVDNKIAQWTDKTGNGYNATESNLTYRPVVSEDANGRPFVHFSNTRLLIQNRGLDTTGNFTCFMVGDAFICSDADNTSSGFWGVKIPDYVVLMSGGAVAYQESIPLYETPSVLAMKLIQGTSLETWANGITDGASAVGGKTILRSGGDYGWSLGAGSIISNFADGGLYELIIFNDSLSDENRQLVEGYLAHKWALESKLPSNHPYKDRAPGETLGGAGSISGIVKLDDTPRQADLYLVDLNACPTVTSDPDTGAYIFSDPGDFSVIPDSDKLLVICHYGENVRPLAHGPVVPEFEVIAVDVDPYWDNVVLLFTVDENGYKDESLSSLTLTPSGTIITVDSAAVDYPKAVSITGGYIGFPNDGSFDFPGAFTIEAFVQSTVTNANNTVFSGQASTVGSSIVLFGRRPDSFAGKSRAFSYSAINGINSDGAIPLSQWVHLAVTRDDQGVVRLFVDGVLQTSTMTTTANHVSSSPRIGGYYSGIYDENILLSAVRITKDLARYTEDFDPPTKAFPTQGPDLIDAWWEHVVLRLPFEGADGSTVFTDESNYDLTVTPYSDARIKTDHFMTGTSAAYFDGAGDYLEIENSQNMSFGAGAFVIEAWCRRSDTGNSFLIYCNGSYDLAGNFVLYIAPSGELSWFEANSLKLSGGLIPTDSWAHIAAVRNAAVLTLYVNGASVGSVGLATQYLSSKNLIGADYYNSAFTGVYSKGYIDDLRITKGHARYTADFVPPKRQLPIEAPEAVADPEWANVVLLLPMNGADNGTVFNDVSLSPKTITRYGNTCTKTDQWRFGGSSAYFDGAGDYLTVADSADLHFDAGAFSVEAWFYLTSTPSADVGVIGKGTSSSGWLLAIDGGTLKPFFLFGSTYTYLTNAISIKEWHHFAVTRDGTGDARVFIDGVLCDAVVCGANFTETSPVGIGTLRVVGNGVFPGYIDDLRITKGVARYTEDFTPPVRNFPNF